MECITCYARISAGSIMARCCPMVIRRAKNPKTYGKIRSARRSLSVRRSHLYRVTRRLIPGVGAETNPSKVWWVGEKANSGKTTTTPERKTRRVREKNRRYINSVIDGINIFIHLVFIRMCVLVVHCTKSIYFYFFFVKKHPSKIHNNYYTMIALKKLKI